MIACYKMATTAFLKTLVRQTCRPAGVRCLRAMSTAQHTDHHRPKLSQFQYRKVLQEFDSVYDRNKDGFICHEDIDLLKSALKKYYLQQGGDMTRTSHMAGYEDYWLLFTELADANKDGKLSRQEWADMWAHINGQAQDQSFLSLPKWVRLMPASLFPVIDTKGDGVIDFEEYQHFWFYLAGYDCKYTKMRSMYLQMTENGKKKLDVKRFEELYADYYLSNDPNSPGKYVAGPVELLSNPRWDYV